MARTKQTARRSTGGKAPRRRLAAKTCGNWGRSPRYYTYGKRTLRSRSLSAEHSSPTESTAPENFPSISESSDSAAQRAVLSSPDLLIIILSQLPHSSLLKVQCVNKTWASLFDHVEIQAALFKKPRPPGAAAYVEPYSDILRDHFEPFWPHPRTDRAVFRQDSTTWMFHPEGWCEAHAPPRSSDANDAHRLSEQGDEERCPYRAQWGQLLVCQPPIEVLEVIKENNYHQGAHEEDGLLELRALIPRPNGLRMGFLLDVVKDWNESEMSTATLLWNRKTGDLVASDYYYLYDSGFKTNDDKPCVAIWGDSSAGDDSGDEEALNQTIEADGEEVQYKLSVPKVARNQYWD